MIRFQQPIILFLLPLSFLPLLLHLLYQKRKKISFTYVFLLKEIVTKQLPKKRLVDLLILFIRCLLIACLLFYFSKPSLNLSLEEKNIIIVIDNSFSTMQKFLNYNKFEFIKRRVKEFLKSLYTEKVKLKLFVLNETLVQISKSLEYQQPDNELLNKIENLKPSFERTNLYALFNYIANSMDAKELNIILFTDLAKNQFLKEQVFKNTFNNRINIFFCYPSYISKNYFIENLGVTNLDKSIEINYYPANTPKIQNRLNVKLKVFDEVVDSHNIKLYEYKNYKFRYTCEEENIWGSIFLALDDGLVEDNSFYFVSYPVEYKKFLCVFKELKYILNYKSKKFYLEKLNFGNLSLKNVYIDEDDISQLFDQYKNIIFIGLPKIKPFVDKIHNKNVIIFLEEGIDYEDYEESLGIEIVNLDESIKSYSLKPIDETFKDFVTQFDYEKITFYKKFYLQPSKLEYNKWQTLLVYNDNSPALIRRNNIFIFTSSLDISYSNLIYKPFFIGLLNYISNLNSFKNNLKNYYYISEVIPLNDIKEIKVKTGNVEKDFYEEMKEGVIFKSPGVYEVVKKNDEIFKIAVNTHPEESYISFVDKVELKNNLKKMGIENINFVEIDNDIFIKKLQKLCFGKDYSNVFLFLFLFLFFLENILSRLLGKLL